MNQILKPKQIVRESTGRECTIEEFLTRGEQGEIYRAERDGKPVALKWYLPASATRGQRAILEYLIQRGPPDYRFLWPRALVLSEDVPGFGYTMWPLMGPHYKGLPDLMERRIEPTFRVLATAGFELSSGLRKFHKAGYCQRDVSVNKIFFDPNTGEILISDNDNVAMDGKGEGGVLGTRPFMAPEVMRGDAPVSNQTDLFSLSVLLFCMLMSRLPLDDNYKLQIAGPNKAVPKHHDNVLDFWPLYPQFLRDLFTKAFTEGIHDPQNGRVRESEWRAAMVRLRDSIVYCADCGSENFYDADALKASGGQPAPCWACAKEVKLPPRIRIGGNVIMLNHDTKLFPHHMDDQKLYDFSQPVVAVTQHPKDPTIWGLKNLSTEKWVVITADGTVRDVEPGRNARLTVGIKVNFGKAEGEIRL